MFFLMALLQLEEDFLVDIPGEDHFTNSPREIHSIGHERMRIAPVWNAISVRIEERILLTERQHRQQDPQHPDQTLDRHQTPPGWRYALQSESRRETS
jgi:hypothetical protein